MALTCIHFDLNRFLELLCEFQIAVVQDEVVFAKDHHGVSDWRFTRLLYHRT